MIELISESAWSRLKIATQRSHRPASVAVAYFGKGASRLLPLRKGSRLVVDASEAAVKSGQTFPAELRKLQKKGVRIYSIENLHAKVFVLGSTAFIGSANVSRRSAETLVEALLATTHPRAVAAARRFVRRNCLQELGPKELERLQRMYRPPRMNGNRFVRRSRKKRGVRPALRHVSLAQLRYEDPPQGSDSVEAAGTKTAKGLMKKPRQHVLEDFWRPGKRPYNRGDLVMQILEDERGRRMAYPPGNVVHMQGWRRGTKVCTFVYIERPNKRRISVGRLARRLGRGAQKRLRRDGRVSAAFAESLLEAWSD